MKKERLPEAFREFIGWNLGNRCGGYNDGYSDLGTIMYTNFKKSKNGNSTLWILTTTGEHEIFNPYVREVTDTEVFINSGFDSIYKIYKTT